MVKPDHDVVIIGAGVCGIYMLYRMLELDLSVTVLEAGEGPGGTWYWNRYPGARFDSESYSYGYSFSEELLQEWDWSEHFAAQPETLRYLEHVVDKFDLASHMEFNARVASAEYDDETAIWYLTLEGGRKITSRIVVTAIGMLSAPTLPRIEGVEDFEGPSFHTYHWPQEPVQVEGKRVAVIGTGATGVQVIADIAPRVGSLTVFQRRPNWCAPLRNGPITEKEQQKIKASYDEIFALCQSTPGGFLHGPDRRDFYLLSEEERYEFWETIYADRGFRVWLGNFREVFMDPEVNAEYSRFIADKIRARINDPEVAEKLIPKDHGFGSRRVPMETNYYEAYNQDNVRLIDLNETPIERVTRMGIQTSAEHLEFDLIIYATGFDAITGAFDRIDIKGKGEKRLTEKWHDGPVTYLGMQSSGFPNLITLAGPQSASVGSNFPRGIEDAVDWATGLIRYMHDHDYREVEADPQAEVDWVAHVKEMYEGGMIENTKSWFTGYNSNVEGHDKVRYMVYFGGFPRYRELLTEVAENDYEGFHFT